MDYSIAKGKKNIAKEILEDITSDISKDIGMFMSELRNELEAHTPKQTTHASINWLIRKRKSNKEYGQNPKELPRKDRTPDTQPKLNNQEKGLDLAQNFDIKKGYGRLVIFNNVDYVEDIIENNRRNLAYYEILSRVSSKYGF